jgi:NADH dehydrogenase
MQRLIPFRGASEGDDEICLDALQKKEYIDCSQEGEMKDEGVRAVTGAFGYSGKHIAARLLDRGFRVITLTNSIRRENPFGERLQAFPFDFDKPEKLTETLKNVKVLYNTYWVRFSRRTFTHADAARNTRKMFEAAKNAGVGRIVHISITNPSEDSPLGYFREKAKLETVLRETGISYAILRPAIVFGNGDILINNIAWALRRFPIFGVFGDGRYRIRPIHVEDLADLAVEQGESTENAVINAVGPETFTFRELVKEIAGIIGKKRIMIRVPPSLGYWGSRIAGSFVGDVIMTREEMRGLMANLLYVDSPAAGNTKLTEWARRHADTLGLRYRSELARRRVK